MTTPEPSHGWLEMIVIDRREPIPPVEQIANAIRNKIATGRLLAGTTLPSVRALARSIGTTPATVARAYTTLQAEGLLAASSGVGTTVVDVQNLERSARQGVMRTADGLLRQSIATLRNMGLSNVDIRAALVARLEAIDVQRRVVFVASARSAFAEFERQLREALTDLPVNVHGITMEEIDAGGSHAHDTLMSADLVVTLLTYKRHLDGLFGGGGPPRVILLAELSIDTIERLLALPSEVEMLFVTDSTYRPIGLGLLQSYCPLARIQVARDLSSGSLAAASAAGPVIVHTLSVKDIVSTVAGNAPTLCLDFRLRSDSLERLRGHLLRDAVAVDESSPIDQEGFVTT
jgi:GntR family transcriptional regulator